MGGISDGKSGLNRGPASLLVVGPQDQPRVMQSRSEKQESIPTIGSVVERKTPGLGSGSPRVCAPGGRPHAVFCFWTSGSSSAQC